MIVVRSAYLLCRLSWARSIRVTAWRIASLRVYISIYGTLSSGMMDCFHE